MILYEKEKAYKFKSRYLFVNKLKAIKYLTRISHLFIYLLAQLLTLIFCL